MSNDKQRSQEFDRMISYQQLLDRESQSVPSVLRMNTQAQLGSESLSTDRYLSRSYHQLEKEKLWTKVWQSTCRETELAETGDFYVHDIAGHSILLMRGEDGSIKGFVNACLHRGRQLKSGSGKSRDIKCPFHGFTWNTAGEFQDMPCQWDFPHVEAADVQLPQVRVECWGGWVFINMNPQAEPLARYLGELVQHFERWQPESTYKALHIKKVLRCNWKLAHEAFIESYHTIATHPQLLLYTGDANSQYDLINKHVSRTITPMGVVSPHISASEQASADQWMAVYGATDDGSGTVPEGKTAREYLGEFNIRRFSDMYQMDLESFCTNAEVLDAILYSVFPNFAPWGGFRPNLTYRFLPYEDSHEQCTMEIFVLMRYPEDQPRPADCPVQFVDADTSLAQTEGIEEGLAAVFDQDFSNLPMVHKGLHSLVSGHIQLANYQEVRIRQFHQTLDAYINA